jgi:putative transposase
MRGFKMPRGHRTHHRRSIRLKGYDYSQPGAYFVTICVHRSACALGEVLDSDVTLTDLGRIASDYWKHVPQHFQDVSIDKFVVMPNHVHAIIIISERRGGVTPPLQTPTLNKIIAYYKYQTTKQINQIRQQIGESFWQRSFYDHIVRNEEELQRIRNYIIDNPLKWELDEYHPLVRS